MRDVLLFAELLGAADGAVLLPLLEELVAEPMHRRVPMFAALRTALAHGDGRVRAAALQGLAGAEGRHALGHFIAALDDDDGEVRRAGVMGLRAIVARDPLRVAHALFHAREDVRRMCVEADATAPLCFYLLADPACRELLAPHLGAPGVEPTLAVPVDGYPVVLGLVRRGLLDVDTAARLLGKIQASLLVASASRGPLRAEGLQGELLAPVARRDPAELGHDGFDGLFEILTGAVDPAAADLLADVGWAVTNASPAEQRRAAAAARATMIRQPRRHVELGTVIACVHPDILLEESVPREVRRSVAAGLATSVLELPAIDGLIAELMIGDLAVDDGRIDLGVAAGILRLARRQHLLFASFPSERIVESAIDDPRGAATLLLGLDRWFSAELLEPLQRRSEAAYALVLAWLAAIAPADQLAFVEQLGAGGVLDLALALAELENSVELRANKVHNLVPLLVARLQDEPAELRGRMRRFAERFLGLGDLEERRFGKAMLEALAKAVGAETFALDLSELPPAALMRLIALLPALTRLPYACELALAYVLSEHDDEDVQRWSRGRIPVDVPPRAPVPEGVYRLSDVEVRRIAACPDAGLDAEIHRHSYTRTVRLAEALAERPTARPSVEVCVALLGCHDDMAAIAEQFERHRSEAAAWLTALDAAVVAAWEPSHELPLLGASWLWRWERHAFAAVSQLFGAPEGPLGVLEATLSLESRLLAEQVWSALGAALLCWSARDVAKVHELVAGETAERLVDLVVGQLDSDVDEGAAKIFVALYRAKVAPALGAIDRVKAMLPDVSDVARRRLEQVMRAWGLLGSARTARRRPRVDPAELPAVRASEDLDALEVWCRSVVDRVVQEAALRMTELGEAALARVAGIILGSPPVACLRSLIESVPLWPEGPALGRLRAALDASDHAAELRFRLAMAFVERGEDLVARAMAFAGEPAKESWFRPGDYERLVMLAGALPTAIGMAASPQPHAYMRAVEVLIGDGGDAPEVIRALRAFLEAGNQRLEDLRIGAASYLHQRGDAIGFPVLLAHALDAGGSYGRLFAGLPERYVDAAVDAALLAGPATVSEARALLLLDTVHVSPEARLRAYQRLLVDVALEHTAERIINMLSGRGIERAERQSALERVARIFAWGTREGLVLTRRRHSVHMSSREHLGFTRFDGDRIWVSALPILRGDRHGESIVEALILHEIGHHRYHRGARAAEAWGQAQREGIHGLLNLVADEHLERNLRALDSRYGDRLKRLAAHAFRHSRRDVAVGSLLALLGDRAFDVLSGCTLSLAQSAGHVRVESGRLLGLMEERGLAFTRFVRALRMGLGDRHDDPLVRDALALFGKRFRRHDMAGLLEVARKLRDMFGWETSLCERFGGHEAHGDEQREHTRWGRGISDDEVQREVERVLNPSKRRVSEDGGDADRLWINVSEEERFEPIHVVEHVPPDRAKHRAVAQQVARHARTLRTYLERLGIAEVRARRRVQGRRLDRGQLNALVLRREPRVLVSRQLAFMSDLFLGVVVDCSGSMAGSDHIDKARRFACLVAEAVRGLPGVDARFLGFTDAVIYDAGDARRCAAASLETNGGNNDAAALLYAARIARKSRRRAKVLVMISDGLPTECSVGALKGLVGRLGRSGMLLAQVAVCALEEQCFPHYVVLEGEMDASVRRFGQVVAKLVSRAMA